VRLENTVWITESGTRDFMAVVPIEAGEIEALMKERRAENGRPPGDVRISRVRGRVRSGLLKRHRPHSRIIRRHFTRLTDQPPKFIPLVVA